MAESLEELFQEYVNLSHVERVKKAIEASQYIIGVLKENNWEPKDINTFLTCVTILFANADGKIAEEEYSLFKDITKGPITREEFRALADTFDADKFVDDMDEMIDGLPDDIRGAIFQYGLAFLSADDKLTVNEQKLFVKIVQK